MTSTPEPPGGPAHPAQDTGPPEPTGPPSPATGGPSGRSGRRAERGRRASRGRRAGRSRSAIPTARTTEEASRRAGQPLPPDAPAEPGHSHSHSHGQGHGHHHGPPSPVSRHLRTVIAAVLIPFAVAVLAGLVVLWPDGGARHGEHHTGVGFDRQMRDARVVSVAEVDCASVGVLPSENSGGPDAAGQQPGGGQGGSEVPGSGGRGCQRATVEVRSGPDRGERFEQVVTPDELQRLSAGQDVVVAHSPQAPPELRYSVTDVRRTVPLVALAAVFAVVVVVIGRLRGLLALVGLAVSFALLTLFILPAILNGSNPLLVAVVGGSVIMLVTLYLCHGWNARTSVAALGTLVSLLLIGLLGSLFIGWAALTGNTSDQTGLIHGLYPHLEIRGLLLAGVLIGSLGVLDDVTVTQTSAVWELRHADPTASWRQLYGAGMRIGRDHIASVVNTLVMAYAGAALPLLLLFSIAHAGVETVATSELVAEEIVRTLVGSIGLVAAVPVTTLLAALVVSADRQPRSAGGRRLPVTNDRRRRKR